MASNLSTPNMPKLDRVKVPAELRGKDFMFFHGFESKIYSTSIENRKQGKQVIKMKT